VNPEIRHVADVPRWHAHERASHSALLFGARETTWAELDGRSSRVARALAAAGIARDRSIAYLGRNTDAYFEIFFGAAKAGAIFVPVNWRLAPPEVAYVLSDCEARILFVEHPFASQIEKVDLAACGVEQIIVVDGSAPGWGDYEPWRDRQSGGDGFAAADPDAPFVQLYTSGTTGRPKGAQLSSGALLLALELQEASGDDCFRIEPDDVGLDYLPLFHVGGVKVAFDQLYHGVAQRILPQFDSGLILEAMRRDNIRRLFLAPTMIQMLLEDPRRRASDFDRLEYVTYGGAPIALDLLRRALPVMKCGFVQTYALTESTGLGAFLSPREHDPRGSERMLSTGRAHPGFEIRIEGPEGETLKPGETGEICLRAPCLMLGYWKRPEATAEAIRGGWLHTGDAGYLDADGYLFVQDRVKDMIVSGAENVYPAEVENAIASHPAVRSVAVIGVPDAKWGEAVKAIVVREPDVAVSEQDIIDYTKSLIAGYKRPRSIDFADELPLGPTGKVLRRELREPYWTGRERRIV
jgi:acyl-CoA synthetase (AMP-forming)/AMP-acid ligase II